MIRSIIYTATLTLAVSIAAVAPAEAQLGGLGNRLKERVRETAAGAAGGGPSADAPAVAGPAASGPRFSANVLEITTDRLDRLRAIAAAEAQEAAYNRESGARAEAARRQRDAFEACSKPEQRRAEQAMEAFVQRYQARAMSGDQQAIKILTDSMQIYQQQMVAGVQQKCGPLPGPRGSSESDGGPAVSSRDLMEQANLNHQQYSVLKERVIAFCRSSAAESLQGASQIPGDGRNIFYVYAASEVEAMKARCGELLPLLGE